MFSSLRDCRTATLRIEMARGHALPWRPRLLLLAHLLYCAHCRRYARQSQQLENLARSPLSPGTMRLADAVRQQLQLRLHNADRH